MDAMSMIPVNSNSGGGGAAAVGAAPMGFGVGTIGTPDFGTKSGFISQGGLGIPGWPGNGAGFQATYADTRRAQFFIDAGGAVFSRFSQSSSVVDTTTQWTRHYTTAYRPTPQDIGAQPATSDRRLKTDIKEFSTNVLDLVKDIKVYTFCMLDNPEVTKLGTMAQDWEQQLPETLLEVPIGEEIYKGLDSLSLVSVLLKQVQELTQKVEQLENK